MKDVDFIGVYEGVMRQIKEGAFLTVKVGAELNTMTIALKECVADLTLENRLLKKA